MMKHHTSYVSTMVESEVFAKTIESLKMPTKYSLTLEKHIRGKKFGSLKSYNYAIDNATSTTGFTETRGTNGHHANV
jgi:AICAR transformylase/IMP cyclohydrolase PurH